MLSKCLSLLNLIKVTRFTIVMVTGLSILSILPIMLSEQIFFVNGQQQQQQSVSGSGQGILPGEIPTLFSFKAAEHKDGGTV